MKKKTNATIVKKRRPRRPVPRDPFYVRPDDIPAGKAYQWFSADVDSVHHAECNGWKPVPFSRHYFRRGYNKNGKVVISHNILMENTRKYVGEQSADGVAKALSLQESCEIKPGMGHIKMVSPSFIVSRDYRSVAENAPPIIAEIDILFRISRDWQDAAAVLGLTAEEYAWRRLLHEPPILACSPDGVFEPVELEVKRS